MVMTVGVVLPVGCHEKTKKSEVEVRGPNKTYEVEVETTERHHDRD